MPFINKPDSSRYLTIFIISFISSLEIISVVVPDPNIFLWIAAFVTDAAAINSNGIKTPSSNGLSIFSIKTNPGCKNGPKNSPRNPPDCQFYITCWIICESFTKLWNFVLVNKNLWGKLFSSLESLTTFEEIFKVT